MLWGNRNTENTSMFNTDTNSNHEIVDRWRGLKYSHWLNGVEDDN